MNSAGENSEGGKGLREQAGEIMACKFVVYDSDWKCYYIRTKERVHFACRHESKQLRGDGSRRNDYFQRNCSKKFVASLLFGLLYGDQYGNLGSRVGHPISRSWYVGHG